MVLNARYGDNTINMVLLMLLVERWVVQVLGVGEGEVAAAGEAHTLETKCRISD